MFIIEVLSDGAWFREGGDYFWNDGEAITAARRRTVKDELQRRVCAWPEVREVWPTATVDPNAPGPILGVR